MKEKVLSLFLAFILLLSCIPLNAFAIDYDATVIVESVSAAAGDTVDVNVNIKNNPGVTGATFTVEYNSNLELISATGGSAFSNLDFMPAGTFVSPCNFTWDSENTEAKEDGTFLKLTFRVSETANKNDKLNINISNRYGDVYNNQKDLNIKIVNGAVTVLDYIPGDLNDDGVVNTKDTRLIRQYIAGGYNITINKEAADVNDDGVINTKDTRLIRQYVAGGYGVKLLPSTPKCEHNLQAVAAKAATCTENGNKAYWHCTKCDKYFLDGAGEAETTIDATVISASHSLVYVSAVAPTTENDGNLEHWKCSVCKKYFLDANATNEVTAEKVIIKKLVKDESTIVYNLYGSDSYLASVGVDNPNPQKFVSENGLALSDITGPEGYVFAGWQDSSGKIITEIKPGMSRTINLTATWRLTEYGIDFLPTSDAAEEINAMPAASVKYTTNKGLTQGELNKCTPSISGYRFLGWSDKSGNIIKEIPKGTNGTITLYANWASEWNRAEATNPNDYEKPLVYEEDGKYMFAYHIGEIKDVVLDVMSDTYKFTAGGPTTRVTVTSNKTIGETQAKSVAETIAQATTKTSTWSLSKDWNSYSSVSRGHTEQNNEYCDKFDQSIKSGSTNISISEDKGGTTENTVDWGINAKVYGKNTTEVGASAKLPIKCVDVGVSAKNTTEIGGELSGHYNNTTVNTGYWNTAASYDRSSAYNKTSSVSSGYSKAVCDNYQIDNSYSQGGSSTQQEAVAVAKTESEEYSSSFSYVTETTETVTKEVVWDKGTEGSWRYVKTGTVAVIATVVYDTKTSTYSVFTQGILRDGTQSEGWQKSMEGGDFSDHQNYVIPFEVPGYVHDYINNAVGYSNGLDVDIETGIVNGYTKENSKTDKHLHIPDYFTQDNGDGTYSITKIKGIAPGAFANCTSLESVRLGKYVTSISDNAFKGCTALKTIDSAELTAIGNNAFANCTSLENYTVGLSVTSLGTNAFIGAKSVIVNAANSKIAEVAISSGAKELTVNLSAMQENIVAGKLANKVLLIGNTTETFTLNGRSADGNAKTYKNIRIESNSAKDVTINGMNFEGNSGTVLKVAAEKLTLNGVNIDTDTGVAVVLKADNTNIALQGKCTVSTKGSCAILGRNISLSRVQGSNITTYLRVNSGDVYSCGSVTDTYDYLQQSDGSKMTDKTTQKIVTISESSYQQLLNDTLDWVLASEAPAGATIVDQKWTYDLTSKTSSSSSSLAGWTKYDTKRTGWGGTQGPVYSDPSNGARNVWSEQYVSSYTHHWCYYHRHIGKGKIGTDSTAPNSYRHVIDLTYALEQYTGYKSPTYGYPYGYVYCGDVDSDHLWLYDREYDSPNYSTRWYYQEPIYTYYYTKTEHKESNTEVKASDSISNVQKYVKYVAK